MTYKCIELQECLEYTMWISATCIAFPPKEILNELRLYAVVFVADA
mgnify:FL=1